MKITSFISAHAAHKAEIKDCSLRPV
jgi:hypothetical protein